MRNRISTWGAVVALALLVPAAHAQQKPDSKASEEYAAQGYEAYNKGDFAAAVGFYQKAYQAAPSGTILFNIAKIYDQKLGELDLAADFYRRYLRAPDAEAELVRRANERLAAIRALKDAQSAPPAASAAPPPASTSPPAHSPPAEPAATRVRYSTSAIVLAGAGGVGLVVGSVFGFRALSKKSDADKHCSGSECTSQAGVDALDSARSAATVSTVGFLVGGALAATGLILYLTSPRDQATTGLYLSPAASPGAANLNLGGRW